MIIFDKDFHAVGVNIKGKQDQQQLFFNEHISSQLPIRNEKHKQSAVPLGLELHPDHSFKHHNALLLVLHDQKNLNWTRLAGKDFFNLIKRLSLVHVTSEIQFLSLVVIGLEQ